MTRLRGIFALLFLAAGARAQDVTISAYVDKNAVALNEQLTLQVTVSGSAMNLPEPQLPSMPNFSVYSSGRSQNIAIVNGHASGAVVYAYNLVPRFVGNAKIGPIAVTVGGRDLKTEPIDVQVTRPPEQAGANPSPTAAPAQTPPRRQPAARASPAAPSVPKEEQGPDVFISASLDKNKAFVNEQATLNVRFYTAVPLLGNPEYVAPEIRGMIAEDLPPERHGQVRLKGKLYTYSEIKTALFAVAPGSLTVGPATVRCQVQQDVRMDPFAPDFFQKFFSQGQGQTKELKTDPLTFQVEALPAERRPASFTGAVGKFRIQGGVDKTSTKVGEAITLTLTLEGTGNLKVLGAPKLPDLPSFRAYDTLIALNLDKAGDVVRGSKAFKTVLVPRSSGAAQIPPIQFSYFDPAAGEYAQVETTPIEVQIAPGAGGQTPAVGYVSPSNANPELTALTEDIRYAKPPRQMTVISELLRAIAAGGWIHLLPLVLFAFLAGNALYQERLNRDPARVRFRQALPKALRKIREAETQLHQDPSQSGALLSDALTGFLADKLDSPPSVLTLKNVQEKVRARFPNAANGKLEALSRVWQDLEQLRFAGTEHFSPAALTSLLDVLQNLVKDLDQRMKP